MFITTKGHRRRGVCRRVELGLGPSESLAPRTLLLLCYGVCMCGACSVQPWILMFKVLDVLASRRPKI